MIIPSLYRSKRIKVLRRLARRRNEAEPQLSGDVNKDIIDDYFDKGFLPCPALLIYNTH